MSDTEITQADREAVFESCRRSMSLAEVFARHRLAARNEALTEAAKVAEELGLLTREMADLPSPLPCDTSEAWRRVVDACADIATAIKALTASQGGEEGQGHSGGTKRCERAERYVSGRFGGHS